MDAPHYTRRTLVQALVSEAADLMQTRLKEVFGEGTDTSGDGTPDSRGDGLQQDVDE